MCVCCFPVAGVQGLGHEGFQSVGAHIPARLVVVALGGLVLDQHNKRILLGSADEAHPGKEQIIGEYQNYDQKPEVDYQVSTGSTLYVLAKSNKDLASTSKKSIYVNIAKRIKNIYPIQ